MLDTSRPIELTHEGTLMSKDGRKWQKGKFEPNTLPPEIAQDLYGKNIDEPEPIAPTIEDKPAAKDVPTAIQDKPPAKVVPIAQI
jgi:hypothetical protein